MKRRDSVSVAKQALDTERIHEANVLSVNRETNSATIQFLNSNETAIVKLSNIDPEYVIDSRSSLLVYIAKSGNIIPIGVWPRRPYPFANPAVTLGDRRGATAFRIVNAAGETVWSVNSLGNQTFYSQTYVTYQVSTPSVLQASYIVQALDDDLTQERKLTQGDGITITDGGANGNITIDLTTPGTLTATTTNVASGNHTHAITALADVSGGESVILKSNAGALTVLDITVAQDLSVSRVDSHLIPKDTDTYDLGSYLLLWDEAFISRLNALVFAEETIQLIGGWFIIPKNAGSFETEIETATTQIDFGKSMTQDDFVLIRSINKSGAYDYEYMQVGTVVTGTTYNVTRDVTAAHSPDPAWPKGTAYLVLGADGDGRIHLNAYDTPRISLVQQGVTAALETELIRIGDLNGEWGYVAETWGMAIGEYAASSPNITIDSTNGLRIRNYSTTIMQFDVSGNARISNKLLMQGASSAITIGTTPPTSASAGTGIWLDRNGLYGLLSDNVQVKIDTTTGALAAGSGKVVLDADGIDVTAIGAWDDISALTFSLGGTIHSEVGAWADSSANEIRLKARPIANKSGGIEITSVAGTSAATSAVVIDARNASDASAASITLSWSSGVYNGRIEYIAADYHTFSGGFVSIDDGLHIGGTSDPGESNLLVDGIATITGLLKPLSRVVDNDYSDSWIGLQEDSLTGFNANGVVISGISDVVISIDSNANESDCVFAICSNAGGASDPTTTDMVFSVSELGAVTCDGAISSSGGKIKGGSGTPTATTGFLMDHGGNTSYMLMSLENNNGAMFQVTGAGHAYYAGDLYSVKSATAYSVAGLKELSAPLTNSSFAASSFSTVGTSTKIENTSWSTTIPADARALIVRMIARDSGTFPTSGWHFSIGPSSTVWQMASVRPLGADILAEFVGVVPCTNGDLWYQVSASGTNTLDVWLQVLGYFI